MIYFVKTPWIVRKLWPSYIWSIDTDQPAIYLTFDDGPHPVATPFVLDTLKKYNAKASFFCIGKNVVANPEIYNRILQEGHVTGNHTYNHLNGWKTESEIYLKDIAEASHHIQSALFRPPYGRIRKFQAINISSAMREPATKIIMWSVLSGDFDISLSKEKCLKQLVRYARNGSIVVFHDSEKAFSRLEYALPAFLDQFSKKGFRFEAISSKSLEKGEKMET